MSVADLFWLMIRKNYLGQNIHCQKTDRQTCRQFQDFWIDHTETFSNKHLNIRNSSKLSCKSSNNNHHIINEESKDSPLSICSPESNDMSTFTLPERDSALTTSISMTSWLSAMFILFRMDFSLHFLAKIAQILEDFIIFVKNYTKPGK